MKRPIIVYVDAEVYDKLKELAEKKGASISQVTREIVYEVIKGGDKRWHV
jgi:predicted CopG family antitoxin